MNLLIKLLEDFSEVEKIAIAVGGGGGIGLVILLTVGKIIPLVKEIIKKGDWKNPQKSIKENKEAIKAIEDIAIHGMKEIEKINKKKN